MDCEQPCRTAAHKPGTRSRIVTTGRNTLNRIVPKFLQDELPAMGYLLDINVLPSLIDKALSFFVTQQDRELGSEEMWSARVAAISR